MLVPEGLSAYMKKFDVCSLGVSQGGITESGFYALTSASLF